MVSLIGFAFDLNLLRQIQSKPQKQTEEQHVFGKAPTTLKTSNLTSATVHSLHIIQWKPENQSYLLENLKS